MTQFGERAAAYVTRSVHAQGEDLRRSAPRRENRRNGRLHRHHGAAEPALDTFLQSVELLRDASHKRDYTAVKWSAVLDAAGFCITHTVRRRLRMEFASWIARMQTPALRRDAIRSLQAGASAQVAAYFELEPDGSFAIDSFAIEAEAV